MKTMTYLTIAAAAVLVCLVSTAVFAHDADGRRVVVGARLSPRFASADVVLLADRRHHGFQFRYQTPLHHRFYPQRYYPYRYPTYPYSYTYRPYLYRPYPYRSYRSYGPYYYDPGCGY